MVQICLLGIFDQFMVIFLEHLRCVESGCSLVVGTFFGFRKHLNTKHTDNTDDDCDIDVRVSNDEEMSVNAERTAVDSEPSMSSKDVVYVCYCFSTTQDVWIKSV